MNVFYDLEKFPSLEKYSIFLSAKDQELIDGTQITITGKRDQFCDVDITHEVYYFT